MTLDDSLSDLKEQVEDRGGFVDVSIFDKRIGYLKMQEREQRRDIAQMKKSFGRPLPRFSLYEEIQKPTPRDILNGLIPGKLEPILTLYQKFLVEQKDFGNPVYLPMGKFDLRLSFGVGMNAHLFVIKAQEIFNERYELVSVSSNGTKRD